MLIKTAEFITSCSHLKGCPEDGFHEIAFVGRSNVGKSSLMNMLLGRKGLVKTSKTPGKTTLLNFFMINTSFYFVDLPGYGYAKRSHAEQEAWKKSIEQYLTRRKQITIIFLLIDCRIGIQENDMQMIEFLNFYNLPYAIVFTKTDKLTKNELGIVKMKNNGAFFASASNNAGKEEIWSYIESLLDV